MNNTDNIFSFITSRSSSASIPDYIYRSYEENVNRLREAGWWFGKDLIGMWLATDEEGVRVAGPASCCELVACTAVKVLEERGL